MDHDLIDRLAGHASSVDTRKALQRKERRFTRTGVMPNAVIPSRWFPTKIVGVIVVSVFADNEYEPDVQEIWMFSWLGETYS